MSAHPAAQPLAQRRVAYTCPQCHLQVHLCLPPLRPHASGVLVLDVATQVRALALHMRTGCTG